MNMILFEEKSISSFLGEYVKQIDKERARERKRVRGRIVERHDLIAEYRKAQHSATGLHKKANVFCIEN